MISSKQARAGNALACDDAVEKIARAVAFGAMAKTVDETGAAIPLRRARLATHCPRGRDGLPVAPALQRSLDQLANELEIANLDRR